VKKPLFLLFALLFSFSLFAQPPEQKLEDAVRIYNRLRDFEDSLQPGKVTQAHIDRIRADIARAQPLLDDVRASGTAEQVKVARYFSANFTYELGFVYGMTGRNKEAYETLQQVEAEYEYFASAPFPMSYRYNGQLYNIAYSNFAPTLAEYYTGMSEIAANLGKNAEALKWARRSLDFRHTTEWYKYIAANKMLEVKKKLDEWDEETLICAVKQLESLTKLDSTYRRTVREHNYPSAELGYERIQTTLEKKPALAEGEEYRGKAAPLLAQLGETQKALEFYRKAIAANYYDDHDYLFEAAEFANRSGDLPLALSAAARLSERIEERECSYLQRLADLYAALGARDEAEAVEKRTSACYRKKNKPQSHDALNLRMYAGIYPGPLLTLYGRYRDYGGVMNVVTRKFAVEASYKLIGRNRLFPGDVTFNGIDLGDWVGYWDGYRAHLGVKCFFDDPGSRGGSGYVGPLLEYMERNLEPIYADVFNANGYYAGYKAFYAQDKVYSLFLNQGFFFADENTPLGIDLFCGIGGSYVRFDGGGEEYNNANYLIAHPLLAARKPARVSLLLRLGLTIGLATK